MAAGNGFFDRSQGIYLPKDTLTWDELGSSPYNSWAGYTAWYQNLSVNSPITELIYESDILDLETSRVATPNLTINILGDGGDEVETLSDAYPRITIEGSNNSDMSSSTSRTVNRDSETFTALGAFRYYRYTVAIETGSNADARGFTGFDFQMGSETIDEIIQDFNTANVDDGSTITRTIPTRATYGKITHISATPKSTITDDLVTGVGGGTANYVASGYVATGYVTQGSSGTVTTSSITTVPIVQLVSSTSNTFTVRIYKPNTGAEVDGIFTFYVTGTESCAVDENGNLVRNV